MLRTEKHELIMDLIKTHHEKTEGKCGISFILLISQSGMSLEEAKPILKELHENKEFHVRDGINDKLFMYGKKKR